MKVLGVPMDLDVPCYHPMDGQPPIDTYKDPIPESWANSRAASSR